MRSFINNRDSEEATVSDKNKTAGKTPRHQFHVRSDVQLRPNIRQNTVLYYIDASPTYELPDRIEANVTLGWQLNNAFELSAAALNLFSHDHPEFGPTEDHIQATIVQRNLYGVISWSF
jgi:hypothetical protein